MASGYYIVLALGTIVMLGVLVGPLLAPQVRPVRIKDDRSPRRR